MRQALQFHHPIPNRRRTFAGLLAPASPWRCDSFSLFLTICSAWAATQLWLWPNDFLGTCAQAGAWLPDHLRTWAAWGGFAAVLKLSGLLCHALGRRQRLARGLLIMGLFMSVLWWTVIAGVLAIRTPHTVAPVVFVGLAFGAAWKLAEWHPDRSAAP